MAFLSCLCGSELRAVHHPPERLFLSCLCGSELFRVNLPVAIKFLSCLCGSEHSAYLVFKAGKFLSGEIISICDRKKDEFARGKTGVSAKELEKIKGNHFDKEIVHRNNIVIL